MIDLHALDHFRITGQEAIERWGWSGDGTCGAFLVPKGDVTLRVVAANGEGWDHVSISCSKGRTPTWAEMEFIKRLFFRPDKTAMQLHVPVSDHINRHPNVLHLWRPHGQEIPRPPGGMV